MASILTSEDRVCIDRFYSITKLLHFHQRIKLDSFNFSCTLLWTKKSMEGFIYFITFDKGNCFV